MKPVFKEEMQYLKINEKLNNYLWVDKRAYRAFDKNGLEVKYGRNLNKLPTSTDNLLTHEEYCDMYYNNNTKKIVEIEREKLIKYISEHKYDEIIVSISGGKDSTVVEHMVRDIYNLLPHRILFGNTSNETHYTYNYIKEIYGDMNLEICSPKEGFYPWIIRNGFVPTRTSRACCSIFKEGNITPYLEKEYNKKLLHICGMRRDESLNRSTYQQVRKAKWENKLAQENWNMYLPIIEFNDLDVWAYLIYHKLKFNELYKFGYGRVGCTNCPYRTGYELELNAKFLPTYDKRWKEIIGDTFIKNGIAVNLNCTLEEFLNGAWRGDIVREQPTQEVIDEFAKYKGIDIELAKRYFRKNKCDCGKKLSKDVIGLNMKLLGRNTNGRMCIKCLSEFVGSDAKKLKDDIKNFKSQGCNLF